jgi:hypothetical protein
MLLEKKGGSLDNGGRTMSVHFEDKKNFPGRENRTIGHPGVGENLVQLRS